MRNTKKVWFIPLIIILVLLMAMIFYAFFSLGGADYTKYPDKKAAIWACAEPNFEIHFAKKAQEAYLEWNGERIQVFVGLHMDYFDVYQVTSSNEPLTDENLLFSGTWKYVRGNMVVTISEDNIFDGAYKKLVFVPQ